jgi:hypothetical protein
MGFYCAHKLDTETALWVRLIVLSPALSSLFTVPDLVGGEHIVTYASLGRAVSILAIYALITSLFTSRPWLKLKGAL